MTAAKLGIWRIAALTLVFVWFFAGGIAHFVRTDVFVSAMPAYIPHPREIVLFTGACELAGALALLARKSRRIAGWAFMLFCLCVLPVHVDMLQHAARYPQLGPAVLWGRLLFQFVYIGIIWFATKSVRAARVEAHLRGKPK